MVSHFGWINRFLLKRLNKNSFLPLKHLEETKEKAKNSPIVYVLVKPNHLDYLMLNFFLLEHQLPLVQFSNNVFFLHFQNPIKLLRRLPKALNRLFFLSKTTQTQLEIQTMLNTLDHFHAVCLFLHLKTKDDNKAFWEALLLLAKNKSIELVPVHVGWTRNPGKIEKSSVDSVFKEYRIPTILNKLFLLFDPASKLYIHMGRPIQLRNFVQQEASKSIDVQSKILRRTLATHFFQSKKIYVGPPLHERRRVIRSILASPGLHNCINQLVKIKKKSHDFFYKKANNILDEMVSNYKPIVIKAAFFMVHLISKKLFDGVHIDENTVQQIRQAMAKGPVIFLPTHKSHMDYLLLSYMFYKNNMPPPHIAAGINLSFFPMGFLFRATGAYFIRRSFSGDVLYSKLLFLYVQWLMRKGFSQEFFIEGGRSRTGKILSPKLGLLSIEIDAFRSSLVEEVTLLPLAITYGRVPEERAYKQEQRGLGKKKESFFGLFQSLYILNRNYARAYITSSKTIGLKERFNKFKNDDDRTLKEDIDLLSNDVAKAMAKGVIVTPTSLLSLVLLNHLEPLSLDKIQDESAWMIRHLKERQVLMAPEILNDPDVCEKTLKFFEKIRWIKKSGAVFEVLAKHRLTLNYHKNTMLHHLLAPHVDWINNLNDIHPNTKQLCLQILNNEFVSFKIDQEHKHSIKDHTLHRSFSNTYQVYMEVAQMIHKGLNVDEMDRKNLKIISQQLNASDFEEALTPSRIALAVDFYQKNKLDALSLSVWISELSRVQFKS